MEPVDGLLPGDHCGWPDVYRLDMCMPAVSVDRAWGCVGGDS